MSSRQSYCLWTVTDVRYLRENFGRIPVTHMDDLLERHSIKGIRNMAHRLGLSSALAPPPERMEKMRAAIRSAIPSIG